MLTFDDTIAAIATAPGAAGLAVVRLSGPASIAAASRIVRGTVALEGAASHTLHHGWAVQPALATDEGGAEALLDEVVVAVFRAPRSYTREDVIEISCHGGAQPAARILAALYAAGARAARPGEFTLRAFLNGRLDLAQAEAVADLIHAGTRRAHDLALSQLHGDLSAQLAAWSERLMDAIAEVEARVDFAEDVGGIEVPAAVVEAVRSLAADIGAVLDSAAFGRAIREGVRVPLVGRPNAGKSALFNALLGEPRAIVTPIAGTTRDRVTEPLEIAGVRVTLADTAGLRASDEPVESLGIAATESAIEAAGVIVWVIDAASPLTSEDEAIARRLEGRPVLVALNKSDQPARVVPAEVERLMNGAPRRIVQVSALLAQGLDSLRHDLADLLGRGSGDGTAAIAVSNQRHVEALERARAALDRAAAVAGREPGEIVALELREALHAIGEVTGRTVDEDVLERIFHRFCIGK